MDLLSAIREGDRDGLAEMFADDVVFHSPATTYRGRDQVADVLIAIGRVFENPTVTREVETVKFVTGDTEGEELNGVLVESRDDDGRITEITLLLRPLATVQKAVVRMARALAEGPQPDA